MSIQENKTITTTDCVLHYIESGPKKGRDIVLLHGMKFQATTWQELNTLEQLANAGFHGLALDMPGFGKSPACDTKHDNVLDGFIAEATLDKPVLVGPSMGGQIALEYAINHPLQLSGLVLVGAVGVQENKNKLHTITIPTLLVWGSEDQISPPANSDILLDGIPDAERVFIKGAPHPCYLDQPDIWHDAVLQFLNKLSE